LAVLRPEATRLVAVPREPPQPLAAEAYYAIGEEEGSASASQVRVERGFSRIAGVSNLVPYNRV